MPELKKQGAKLYLQLFVGNSRFALSAKDVIAIVPVVSLHKVPKSPDYIVGILNYHGDSVPVIDVQELLAGKKSNNRLKNDRRLIGLLAEKLTEVTRVDESEFKASGVQNDNARYLGDVLTDDKGILQRLKVSEMLPKAAQKILFI